MDNVNNLGTEKIWKLFFKYTLPAIAGMIVFASYNVVDRIFVGRGVGPLAISGITITFPILIIFMGFGMLVGMGATALISIKLGQKNKAEAELVFGNSLVLSVITSTILMFVAYMFMDGILATLAEAARYLHWLRITCM